MDGYAIMVFCLDLYFLFKYIPAHCAQVLIQKALTFNGSKSFEEFLQMHEKLSESQLNLKTINSL